MASEDYEKGAEYARLEARKYNKLGSFSDAVEYAKRSVACLEKLPQNESVQKKIIDMRVTLATYYLLLNYFIEAKDTVEPVINLALDLNYQKRLPGIYLAMGMYYASIEEDFSKGEQYFNNVFEIAVKVGDFVTLWLANHQLGTGIIFNYQFEKSMACLKTSLDLSVMANNLTGISLAKSSMGMNYNLQGKTELASQVSKGALQAATESDDMPAKQASYTSYGTSCYYKGLLDEAEKYLLESLVYHEKTSQAAWGAYASGNLGWSYLDMGNYDKAKEYQKRCIKILVDASFFPSWLNVHRLFFAKAKILSHEPDIDLNELNNFIASHEKNRLAVCESFGTRCIGEIYLHIDDRHMVEAEAWIKRAIEANTKYDTKWELARSHALYADWFKKKGDTHGAKEQLTKAIDLFQKCGADGWVEKYEKELVRIST
jgi:tetratricopeptide (TPR) repeat protein